MKFLPHYLTRFSRHFVTLISIARPKFCAPVLPTSGANFWEEKKEDIWSEQFLLEVYIVVCYFSLIIFPTVELTSFATREELAIIDLHIFFYILIFIL